MLIRILKPDFEFDNENGKLVQVIHEGWKQVNVIMSYAESIRGGHYHKFNTECFYVINGKFKLHVRRNKFSESYVFQAGEMFTIPAYVYHTFEYMEDTLLVALYSQGVELDINTKDIWT